MNVKISKLMLHEKVIFLHKTLVSDHDFVNPP